MESIERTSPVSEFEIKALTRDALALKPIAPGASYIALAAIASLKWDFEEVLELNRAGVHSENKVSNFLNAIVNLNFVNRMDLAVEFIQQAFETFGPDKDLVQLAISTYIALADLDTAIAIYQAARPDEYVNGIKGINPEAVAISLKKLSITKQRFSAELKLGFEVLSEHSGRYAALGVDMVTIDHQLECVVINIYFCGTDADELFFETELAQRLIMREDWDPRALSIRFAPVGVHPQNVH